MTDCKALTKTEILIITLKQRKHVHYINSKMLYSLQFTNHNKVQQKSFCHLQPENEFLLYICIQFVPISNLANIANYSIWHLIRLLALRRMPRRSIRRKFRLLRLPKWLLASTHFSHQLENVLAVVSIVNDQFFRFVVIVRYDSLVCRRYDTRVFATGHQGSSCPSQFLNSELRINNFVRICRFSDIVESAPNRI